MQHWENKFPVVQLTLQNTACRHQINCCIKWHGLFITSGKHCNMNSFFKTLVAGYGAKKLGGGCFSTILIFFLIYWALGTCNKPAQPVRQGNNIEAPAIPAPPVSAALY
jgi:hypothetical protein